MYNNLRITGLASGIDTEEMISNLMNAEKIRLNRVEADKQLLVWKQELYNNINKDFANFILDSRKDFGLTTVTSTGTLLSNSYENLSWVKKATSSSEDTATVNATAKAVNGTYSVNVQQLAEGVTLASSGNITVGTSKENLAAQFGLTDADTIQFTITTDKGTKEFSFLGTNTMTDVVNAINSAKVTVDGKEVSLGVKAMYDSTIDRFFLQTTGMGKNASLNIEATSGSVGEAFIGKLNLNATYYSYENEIDLTGTKHVGEKFTVNTKYQGASAIIDFAGATGIEMFSNQFTINGIDFNLKTSGNFNVTVDTDVDKVYEKIDNFVKKYNELVEKSNKLLTEKQYRDYKPLTAEQKKDMDKKDIELWEEKAKSGLLRSDEITSRTMANIRSWMYEEVEGVNGSYDQITEIGITTEKFLSGSVGGKLTIDETKLKTALREDANGVLELLFKEPDYENLGINPYSPESSLSKEQLESKRKNSGIVTRLYDNMIQGMQSIIEKAGTGDDSSLYRNVKSNILIDFVTKHGSISLIEEDVLKMERKIDDINDYLVRKENSYYQQFAAMEKAISQMNQQSMWLTQQFSGR